MIVIARKKRTDQQTMGEFTTIGGHESVSGFTLELPWLDNKRDVSCIPPGRYIIKKEVSPALGKVFRVYGVPGRSGILIHAGNYRYQIKGCILVGAGYSDIDSDGAADLTRSQLTLKKLYAIMATESELIIKEAFSEHQ